MIEFGDLVAAGVFASEKEATREALRCLLRSRPDLRLQIAIHRYQTEAISLAKAASLAGISWAQMHDLLMQRGIQPRLGPETMDDLRAEVASLRDWTADSE
jgi:predicted HTH domain antitoxin